MQGDGGLDNALVMILVIFAGALFGGGVPWEEFMATINTDWLLWLCFWQLIFGRFSSFVGVCYFVKPLLLLNTIRDPSFLHCSPKVW